MLFTLAHPEIRKSISDLRIVVQNSLEYIDSIQLFGSALIIPIEEAKDIDFFISYKSIGFDKIRNQLLSNNMERHIAIENQESAYSNCPPWTNERPLTLHIVLYREGKSQFSEKLLRTKEKSLDITAIVKGS